MDQAISEDVCSISPQRPNTGLHPQHCQHHPGDADDADDAMHASDARQGLKGTCKETGVTGSEQNESQRNCTKMKRVLEKNRDSGKCKGRTRREPDSETKRERNSNKGVFKKMKGAETAVTWKEVKGHARKLLGKTCKGSKVQIIPRINRI